jgi:ketosteroid isomerase-like protein
MNHAIWRIVPLAGLLLSGLLACAMAPAADSELASAEAAMQQWTTAINAQDVVTLSATMTDDIELANDTGTVSGRDAAVRALRNIAARGALVANTREITIVGDLAWRVVGFTQIQTGSVVHSRGHALEIWKRVDGEWRLHRQTWAGVGKPEESLTRPSTKEPVLDRLE